MRARPALLPALLGVLAGCAVPPEAPPANAAALASPWPRIVPFEAIAAGPAPRQDAAAPAALAPRAASLRARAAALRAPVIDGATRARLTRPRD